MKREKLASLEKMSEWKVYFNPELAPTPYGIYRLKDKDAVNNASNRQEFGGVFKTKHFAQRLADELNESRYAE
ncbi:MAG: hypothetical protein RSA49_05395 [Anaerovoracaceae bacterium]